MRAMILAAGKGTRLFPLTADKPKALIEINGKTLLETCIYKLRDSGFTEVVINVHHFAGQIIEYLEKHGNFGLDIIISDESDELLDSGGGILKALSLLGNEPFLVHNADVISDINLKSFCNHFKKSGSAACLAVRNRKSSRYLLTDKSMQLKGWKNVQTKETKIVTDNDESSLQAWAYSGIQIIEPSLLKNSGFTGRFSIIDMYLSLAPDNKIIVYPHDNDYWFDLGKIEDIDEIKLKLKTPGK